MDKTYKCGWSHCKHDSIITQDQNFLKEKTRYYHVDCLEQKQTIEDIITIFLEQINPDIVISTLRSIVNTMVFKQGEDEKYILFAIQYAVRHPEMKLTYPQGLYRIVKDKNVRESWKKMMAKKEYKDEKVELNNKEHTFVYKQPKEKTIADLFG